MGFKLNIIKKLIKYYDFMNIGLIFHGLKITHNLNQNSVIHL